jgi:hypothetical protein
MLNNVALFITTNCFSFLVKELLAEGVTHLTSFYNVKFS